MKFASSRLTCRFTQTEFSPGRLTCSVGRIFLSGSSLAHSDEFRTRKNNMQALGHSRVPTRSDASSSTCPTRWLVHHHSVGRIFIDMLDSVVFINLFDSVAHTSSDSDGHARPTPSCLHHARRLRVTNDSTFAAASSLCASKIKPLSSFSCFIFS